MTREKTRPTNNFHCFEGVGRPWWLAVAKGHKPVSVRTGPMGASIELQLEDDGFVVQNGGMASPQEVKMPPGTYYRFFGTIAHNRWGSKSSMAGGWWVDYEGALAIADWADRHDLSLAQAARKLLVIPNEWQDCGYCGRARLLTTLKAWIGHGKPATGNHSPDNAGRQGQVHAAPPMASLKQWFVPGERELLGRMFDCDTPVQVIRKGVRPAGL